MKYNELTAGANRDRKRVGVVSQPVVVKLLVVVLRVKAHVQVRSSALLSKVDNVHSYVPSLRLVVLRVFVLLHKLCILIHLTTSRVRLSITLRSSSKVTLAHLSTQLRSSLVVNLLLH